MALSPLATTTDLEAFGVSTDDAALTAAALDAASAAVREAAGAMISRATSTFVVPVTSPGSHWIDLPVAPAVAVESVSVGGVDVDGWRLIGNAVWSPRPWADCVPAAAVVTAVHGYDPVPADIVLLVCELAGAVVAAATEGGGVETRLGVQSERIDDYSVTFETGKGGAVSVLDLPERSRAALRRRFGGGAFVTGSR